MNSYPGDFLTPTMRAALKACREAMWAPNSLVRVTLTGAGQADVVQWCSNWAANMGVLDFDKTMAHALNSLSGSGQGRENATLELTNGSAIEFVVELNS